MANFGIFLVLITLLAGRYGQYGSFERKSSKSGTSIALNDVFALVVRLDKAAERVTYC